PPWCTPSSVARWPRPAAPRPPSKGAGACSPAWESASSLPARCSPASGHASAGGTASSRSPCCWPSSRWSGWRSPRSPPSSSSPAASSSSRRSA
ncbi:uncharacterized protein METZ01_LOCUS333219, partial [marine metagenome]